MKIKEELKSAIQEMCRVAEEELSITCNEIIYNERNLSQDLLAKPTITIKFIVEEKAK